MKLTEQERIDRVAKAINDAQKENNCEVHVLCDSQMPAGKQFQLTIKALPEPQGQDKQQEAQNQEPEKTG